MFKSLKTNAPCISSVLTINTQLTNFTLRDKCLIVKNKSFAKYIHLQIFSSHLLNHLSDLHQLRRLGRRSKQPSNSTRHYLHSSRQIREERRAHTLRANNRGKATFPTREIKMARNKFEYLNQTSVSGLNSGSEFRNEVTRRFSRISRDLRTRSSCQPRYNDGRVAINPRGAKQLPGGESSTRILIARANMRGVEILSREK